MGNQCLNKSLPMNRNRPSITDDVMEAERDSMLRKRRDIRKQKKEIITSQLSIGGSSENGESVQGNDGKYSETSSRKSKNVSGQNLRKQNFKEDEVGYESPMKRQAEYESFVNSLKSEEMRELQEDFRIQGSEIGTDYRKQSEGSSLPGTFVESYHEDPNYIFEKKITLQQEQQQQQNQFDRYNYKSQENSQSSLQNSQPAQNPLQQAQSSKKDKKKPKKNIKPNKALLENPALKKIQKELDQANKRFVPLENQDSDYNLEDIANIDSDDPTLPDIIVQKAYSVGGIRLYNYIFKQKRRDNLGEDLLFKDEYLILCSQYLNNIQNLLRRNLETIRVKLQMDIEDFENCLQRADLQYSSLQGLGRRMELPVLDQAVAQDLHQKLKSRVMNLWRENQEAFQSKNFDLDIVLQALQCYAEDMLQMESGLEIEQLHRVVFSGLNLSSCEEEGFNNAEREPQQFFQAPTQQQPAGQKKKGRLSIFTIDEENSEDEEGAGGARRR